MNPLTVEWVDKDTAREALKFCKEVRQAVRLSLGLSP